MLNSLFALRSTECDTHYVTYKIEMGLLLVFLKFFLTA